MKKIMKILSYLITGILALCVIGLLVSFIFFTLSNRKSEDHYIITRTNDYPPTVKKISKEYNTYSRNLQYIPIKAHIEIDLTYLCIVEFVDSTYLVNYTNNYFGNFHYERLRFHTWQLIELSKDSTYISWEIREWIKDDYKFENDTIYSMGLKIYDIEKYTFEKEIKYDIYVEDEFEGNQTF